ncbi:MAG: hypothetical protein QOF48_2901 [Verrucomicrobiota bacterium]|jgi:hypothetical protein
MKVIQLLHCPATLLMFTLIATARGADDPAPPPGRPSREELKEKFKGLTVEERQARIKELREKAGPSGATNEEMLKRQAEFRKYRESVKDLPPAERETKLREWREKNPLVPPGPTGIPAEEREVRRKEFSKRTQEQIAELTKKKSEGTLNENETRRLERLQEMLKRLESGGNTGGTGLPVPRPPGEIQKTPGEPPARPVKPSDVK